MSAECLHLANIYRSCCVPGTALGTMDVSVNTTGQNLMEITRKIAIKKLKVFLSLSPCSHIICL